MGVLDSAVRNAEFVQARGPGLQLTTVTAGEGHMIEAGAMLIEPATCAIGVGMQAEQLPSIECEHRVGKPPASSSEQHPAPSNSLYQRVLRSRSVTVTATWVIDGNLATAASWWTVKNPGMIMD